jgi:hypothetical protein
MKRVKSPAAASGGKLVSDRKKQPVLSVQNRLRHRRWTCRHRGMITVPFSNREGRIVSDCDPGKKRSLFSGHTVIGEALRQHSAATILLYIY